MPLNPKFFLLLPLLCMMVGSSVSAQSWMAGYNYRKRITINKAQVAGAVNLIDFPVLISITDPDLVYLTSQCNTNKLSSGQGLDITFANVSDPAIPLRFQLDHYDPVTGTLICWVKVPALVAAGNVAAGSELLLYYGSNLLHAPYAASSVATWTELYKLWHMNLDASPAGSMSGKSNQPQDMAQGGGGMDPQSFVAGKIGYAAKYNGSSSFMNAAKDTSTTFTISVWAKISRLNVEQVLISNDSTGFGGYTIRINASGNIVFDTRIGSRTTPVTLIAGTILLPEQWYHFVVQRVGSTRTIYINGKSATAFTRLEGVGSGGRLIIGRSKQNDRYFGGLLDEIRITGQVLSANWIKTEYNNQNDPATFYTVGAEEQNLVVTPTGYTFTQALSADWSEPGNWNQGRVPEPYANVVVKSASKLNISDLAAVYINKLTLETGAVLSLKNTKLFLCNTNIAMNAAIRVSEQSVLQFNGNIINDGLVDASDVTGTITLAPNQSVSSITGTGSIRVSSLRLKAITATQVLNLAEPMFVSKVLTLEKGILNSNGLLTLTATASQAAALGPVNDPSTASVIGEVKVESYVTGSFPTPSSARGWRLWTAPVYATLVNGIPEYDLLSIKKSVFVTGKGGAVNGFDDSPQNGNTIYTHDQSIAGTLPQKYIPIANMSVHVLLGRGVYIYSRGPRDGLDAFKHQVQSPPFVNPEPYTLTYSGKLFTGDLRIALSSRNRKEEGDGFNLLGNPYASTIRWGSLDKEHTGPFVWMFNTLNNAYVVSDDPELRIPAGSGFFVKLLEGESNGTVTFHENAKVSSVQVQQKSATLSGIRQASMDINLAASGSSESAKGIRLEATISRDDFSQRYVLKLVPGGTDQITDADAPSLGDGYLAIAGLAEGNVKLDVDSRGMPEPELTVNLYVKSWASGEYAIDFAGFEQFSVLDSIFLEDKYLNSSQRLTGTNSQYRFQINTDIPDSQGAVRFSLRIKKGTMHAEPSIALYDKENQVIVYPNPFQDNIQLKTSEHFPEHMKVFIRDMMGKLQQILIPEEIDKGSCISVNAGSLSKGMYILELIDAKTNKRLKSAKIIKL
jgi:hypothetical protein